MQGQAAADIAKPGNRSGKTDRGNNTNSNDIFDIYVIH